ncbi:YHS domain-containing protein [Tenacibaculum sp. MAR_2009_124]|uniref:YHS domain-containing (seleno)protein n=1 Tax=Tenacibaculum sp. MAR_2009_124 TaxID=1250059 RepID=UPI000899DB4A|nr:YHS domain-containing (seleno)protein [Tenacibaculum sp. MAR_2009_124]SEC48247.1 YHS domain-containing protein [Tenacibaculum sp. MAR_2009_124]
MNKLVIIFLFICSLGYSQKNYNVKKGLVAKGYDVVAYFNNAATKGNKKFSTSYNEATFRFSSQKNLEKFKGSPEKYVPQYGGYCAYAIGKTGEKVDINPKTFEIRDNKLYLFYNAWGTNTLKLWNEESPEKLKEQADKNWKSINH